MKKFGFKTGWHRARQKHAVPPPQNNRSTRGALLVECLISIGISAVLMAAMWGAVSRSYRAATNNMNQVLASNLAQQVIDHARDMTYGDLLQLLGTQTQVEQTLKLYASDDNVTLFPRAIARSQDDNGMAYSQQARSNVFNGTITETLSKVNASTLQVQVAINWSDQSGKHKFNTSTYISQYGIHTY